MGTGSSAGVEDAKILRQVQHPHLGNLAHLKSNTVDCYRKVYTFTDGYLLQETLRKLNNRINKLGANEHSLNVYRIQHNQKSDLCSTTHFLGVCIEHFDLSINQSIRARLVECRNYSEHQIYDFLAQAVDSLFHLHDTGLRNIQLDGQSIVYCDKHLKILDSTLACSNSYNRLLACKQLLASQQKIFPVLPREMDSLYLAPELLKDLKENNADPYLSPKADIFSLAMLALHMICLEPMSGYYNYRDNLIDYESLILRVARITHSLQLKTLLAEMLQLDSELRIGLLGLREKLAGYLHTKPHLTGRSKSYRMLQEMLGKDNSKHKEKNHMSDRKVENKRENETGKNKGSPKVCRMNRLNTMQVAREDKQVKTAEMRPYQVHQSAFSGNSSKNMVSQVTKLRHLVKGKLVRGKKDKKDKNICEKQNVKGNVNAKFKTNSQLPVNKQLIKSQFNCNNRLEKTNVILRNEKQFNEGKRSQTQNRRSALWLQLPNEISERNLSNSGQDHLRQGKDSIKTSRFADCKESRFDVDTENDRSQTLILQLGLDTELKAEKDNASQISQKISDSQRRCDHLLDQLVSENNKEILPTITTINSIEVVNKRNVQKMLQWWPKTTTYEQSQNNKHLVQQSGGKIVENKNNRNFFSVGSRLSSTVSCEQEQMLEINVLEVPNRPNIPEVSPFRKKKKKMELNLNLPYSPERASVSGMRDNEILKPEQRSDLSKAYHISPVSLAVDIRSKLQIMYRTSKSVDDQEQTERQDNSIEDRMKCNVQEYQQRQSKQQLEEIYKQRPWQNKKWEIKEGEIKLRENKQWENHQWENKRYENLQIDNKTVLNSRQEKAKEDSSHSHTHRVYFSNGDHYEGELVNDSIPHGNGTLYSKDHAIIYSGCWRQGHYNGYGTLTNRNHDPSLPVDYRHLSLAQNTWLKYEGEFEKSLKNGFGTLYYRGGDKFSGCLKDDIVNGYGCYYYQDGRVISGLWQHNEFGNF